VPLVARLKSLGISLGTIDYLRDFRGPCQALKGRKSHKCMKNGRLSEAIWLAVYNITFLIMICHTQNVQIHFQVQILSGKDKGKQGKVKDVIRSKNTIIVAGLNTVRTLHNISFDAICHLHSIEV
jgi:hypothetical protein